MQLLFAIFWYVIQVYLSCVEGRFSFLLVDEAVVCPGLDMQCIPVDNFSAIQFCKQVKGVVFGVIPPGSDLLFLRC